jgi:glycerol uptake facilitator-like aquaporin
MTAAFDLPRRLVAEALGSALLLAVVIGSGIMGERLAGGNVAIALLGNTLATGAGLVVLIIVFGPISGAHFNPAVTLVAVLRREIAGRDALLYPLAQVAGAIAGVWLAHAMFGEPILQISTKLREGPAQMLAETVATFGLVATILGAVRFRPDFTAVAGGR